MIRHELNETDLILEEPATYAQDYQIHMLAENTFAHLIETTACCMDGNSQYIYNISGKESLSKMYETDRIDKTDMIIIVEQMMEAVEEVQNHMLDANRLILNPDYIFYERGCFFFCYYPLWKENLCEGFHKLTEFFIRELNYETQDGVIMAFELHKGTMTDHYDIDEIMIRIEAAAAEVKTAVTLNKQKEKKAELWEDDWIEAEERGYPVLRETSDYREGGKLGKILGSRRKPKWGQWEDLLMAEESSIIQGNR